MSRTIGMALRANGTVGYGLPAYLPWRVCKSPEVVVLCRLDALDGTPSNTCLQLIVYIQERRDQARADLPPRMHQRSLSGSTKDWLVHHVGFCKCWGRKDEKLSSIAHSPFSISLWSVSWPPCLSQSSILPAAHCCLLTPISTAADAQFSPWL